MLYLHYTDSNGVTYEDILFYDPTGSYLGFTYDVSALAKAFAGEEFDTVTYTFVPMTFC